MPDKTLTRLHRVTELFVAGKEIVLLDDPSEPVLVWVNKLNSFQRGDAQRDGQAGQARRLATLSDDSEDIAVLLKQVGDYNDEQLIEAILSPRQSEFLIDARDDVAADPTWTEKLVLIERGDALAADGSHQTDTEAAAVETTNAEYLGAVQAAMDERRKAATEELRAKDHGELVKEYLDVYRRLMGFQVFQDEYSRTEVWYALRDCTAVRKATSESGWDHSKCTHPRLLPNRAAVAEMPDDLLSKVTDALNELAMPPAAAGNSAAPQTSSGSSEQPSSAEDSTASTPTET